MSNAVYSPSFEAFKSGTLFTLKISPNNKTNKIILIIPPFAEEMNKSRRMMSTLLATAARDDITGYLFDLYGTGDSEGDFCDATWQRWLDNVFEMIVHCCKTQGVKSLSIVAIRSGALLLNDLINRDSSRLTTYLKDIHYWCPVINSAQFVNQLFRVCLASNMLKKNAKSTIAELFQLLEEDGWIDIAGYRLNSELVRSIKEANEYVSDTNVEARFFFYELTKSGVRSPAFLNYIKRIEDEHVSVTSKSITGLPFWNSQEISINNELIDETILNLHTIQSVSNE
jgi:exosortase A-associated hydrolase 2